MRAFWLLLGACVATGCGGKDPPPLRADPTPTPWYKAPPMRPQGTVVGVPATSEGARTARWLVEERGFDVIALDDPSAACDELAWACASGVRFVGLDRADDLEGARVIVWTDAPTLARLGYAE